MAAEKREEKIAGYPKLLIDRPHHYCPGCSHGILHRLLAEVFGEMGIEGDVIGISSIGCSALVYQYLDIDFVSAPPGKAPAVASGLSRELPRKIVFTYQGDGDLASVGLSELIHAALRAETITIVCLNNLNFGMSGGQISPTSLLGQRTTASPSGKDLKRGGHTLRVTDLLLPLPGVTYLARASLHSPAQVRKTKLFLKRAFSNHLYHGGLSFIEVMGLCPTHWGLTPLEASRWVKENVISYFPVEEIKVFT
jgi:2-oxoglutarate ferredoxin oxidoreductase subunit beta